MKNKNEGQRSRRQRMDCLPGNRRGMNRHTIADLHQLQALPLSVKIRKTEGRIREWADHYGKNGIFLSYSGGKDSSVLKHIAEKIYPDLPAVYVDTSLEYPEIRQFVKQQGNVEILRPRMNFRQVIERYGYPFISKEVAECVYGARRYMEKLKVRENDSCHCTVVSNYSYMADLAGIDRREDKQNALYQSLIHGEIPGTELKAPVRYLILQGKYPHKENGVETSEYSKMYNKERYRFFLEAPFEISNRCCSVMKKAPLNSYAKRTGRMPLTAQLASESRLRTANWLKNGCNGFHMKSPISNPMSFWTEQDVLEYIYHYQIPIADIYGKVQMEYRKNRKKAGKKEALDTETYDLEKPLYKTTGCNRSGCIYCGFGCHREKSPNRWELAESMSNPKIIDYMLRGGGFDENGIWKPDGRGLGFWFVIEWINIHGNLHIIMPRREEYLGRYLTRETERHLAVQDEKTTESPDRVHETDYA